MSNKKRKRELLRVKRGRPKLNHVPNKSEGITIVGLCEVRAKEFLKLKETIKELEAEEARLKAEIWDLRRELGLCGIGDE